MKRLFCLALLFAFIPSVTAQQTRTASDAPLDAAQDAALDVAADAALDAAAATPARLTYTGLLTDADGTPLPDGAHELSFHAYASYNAAQAQTGGLWSETHTAPVSGGRFLVLLGSESDLPADARWLTISVDGEASSAPVPVSTAATSSAASGAPGNTLEESYLNDRIIDIVPGQPIFLRGPTGTTSAGFIVRDVRTIFAAAEQARFQVRSNGANRTWEHRVYGSSGFVRPVGTYAISDVSGGGLDAMVIEPNPQEELLVLSGATANVGSESNPAEFQVYTTPNPLGTDTGFVGFDVQNDNNTGSASNWYTEDGTIHTRIEADGSGEGGFFTVANGNAGAAFQVNGSNSGGSRTTVGAGNGQSIFDDTITGDDSVILPRDAVSANETLGEAGAANEFSGALIALTPGYQVLISRTLTAPASGGHVIAIASVDVQFSHTSGASTSAAEFAVTDDCDASPLVGSASDFDIGLPSDVATGFYNFSASPSGLFVVPPGPTTFCLVGSELSGDATTVDHQLSLVFVPTAYGSTVSNVADGAPSAADGDGPVGRALTASDVAAERDASVRDNETRIADELRGMRERIAELEARVDGEQ